MPDDVATTAQELRLAIRRLTARLREESVDATLAGPQRVVLAHLDTDGPLTVSALARLEAVRSQSVGATVRTLEAEGLVERHPHPTDGRGRLVAVTDAGRAALGPARARRLEWLATALERELDAGELQTLRDATRILERITRA